MSVYGAFGDLQLRLVCNANPFNADKAWELDGLCYLAADLFADLFGDFFCSFTSFGIMCLSDGQPFDQNRVARMFERLSEAIFSLSTLDCL